MVVVDGIVGPVTVKPYKTDDGQEGQYAFAPIIDVEAFDKAEIRASNDGIAPMKLALDGLVGRHVVVQVDPRSRGTGAARLVFVKLLEVAPAAVASPAK
jgi:hypothetical protein